MDLRSRLETLARLGFAARGLVYFLIGYAAYQASRGAGRAQGGGEAIEDLGGSSFGPVLLALIALGMLGYGVWRIVNAWVGESDGSGGREGPFVRAGHTLSGAAHLLLAFTAARLLFTGSGGSGEDSQAQGAAASAMALPFGETLVVLAGVVLMAAGIGQLTEAVRAAFMRHIGATGDARRAVEWIGRAGYLARGLVFAFAGYLLFQAGLRSDADEASGLGGVLERVQAFPAGDTLLLLIAVGLVMFGVFSFVLARYRQVRIADPTRGQLIGRARRSR